MKKKVLSSKEFAEMQLREIREINKEVRKKTRKMIIIAFAANLILMIVMLILVKYLETK